MPHGHQIVVIYCWTRVLLYAKMLNDTEKHRLLCHILSLVYCCHFNWGGGPLAPPLATLVFERWAPGTVPYGKSGPGYCITFIERWDEDQR